MQLISKPAVPSNWSQCKALLIKQFTLQRRDKGTFIYNICFPFLMILGILLLNLLINAIVQSSIPLNSNPNITQAWFLYEKDPNNSTATAFKPPASFYYYSNNQSLGTFSPNSNNTQPAGLLDYAKQNTSAVRFVDFNINFGYGSISEQIKSLITPLIAVEQASDFALLNTIFQEYLIENRTNSPIAAFEFNTINFIDRIFSYTVLVNSSISGYLDIPAALSIIDQAISLALNRTAPAIMKFLGIVTFPIISSHVDSIDLTETAGPFFYTLLLHMLFPAFVSLIVYEKKLFQIMKMNGLRMRNWWIVNYVLFFAFYLAAMIFLMIAGHIARFRFFTINNNGIIFIHLFLWGNVLVAGTFVAATMFEETRTASVVCYFYVICQALVAQLLLYPFIQERGQHITLVSIVCAWPSFALFRGLVYLGIETAYSGVGINFHNINTLEGERIDLCWPDLIVVWIILMILALYLQQVLPSGYGVKKHPLFFLQYNYWSPKALPVASEIELQPLDAEPADVSAERQRMLNNNNNSLIQILNISKEYSTDRGVLKACRDITLGIEQGQCLGVLGSNGAGKTTLISILCGLFSPTSGDAIIDGYSIKTEIDKVHTIMGICPQNDLLWPELTGEEHLLFYGRLKGLKGKQLDEQVTQALSSVKLLEARSKLSKKYSGGMKRRLSVAISLLASPKVVFLDEPSTGLDPASRLLCGRSLMNAKRNVQ